MGSLTEKVLHYQKTGEGLRDIVGELGPRVYQFPRRTMGWDEDACGDFYVFIHPRMLRLLERFRDQGKPFESYLWAVLNWQLRNFARERRQKELDWRVSLRMETCNPHGVDLSAAGREDAAGGSDLPRPSPELLRVLQSPADRRNFLFLVLKCSRTLDPSSAGHLAALAGVARERLLDVAGTLRELRASREQRLETFRCRRNKAFAKVLLIETELKGEFEQCRIEALQAALRRARRRMQSAAQRMARVGMSPTNREIAAVLGVPKGTVDSGLYWLKRKLAAVYDPDHLRSA
jgi:DNA-directed RNA polymerase specialized sigma24 family protein